MPNFSHLDALLKDFVQNGPAGCGCAVAKDGKVLYEGYHGFLDKEQGVPITADSVYRMYSMTKVVVCTAAMMLYERGKFLLSDPLYEYFPEYKEHVIATELPNGNVVYEKSPSPMLAKHAFSMAVGLPYPSDKTPTGREWLRLQKELQQKGPYDLQMLIRTMAQVPLAAEPGTRFQYGHGHELVAGLIEVCSGKSVGDFLRQEIFEPLGMNSTGYRYFGDIEKRMVAMYEKGEDGTLCKTPGYDDALFAPDAKLEYGGSGLFSTVGDYLKFSQMLALGGTWENQRIMSPKTINLMRQNQLNEQQLKDFTGTYTAGYGYGLGVRTMMDLAKGGANSSVGEFGWTGMLGTWTSIDPSEGVSAVYMHQMMPNMELYHHLRVRAAAFGGL